MKHRRAAVLQQHVEALAEVRLKLEKYISLGLNTDIGQGRRGTRSLQPPACSVFDKYVNSRYRRFTQSVRWSDCLWLGGQNTVINNRGSDAIVLSCAQPISLSLETLLLQSQVLQHDCASRRPRNPKRSLWLCVWDFGLLVPRTRSTHFTTQREKIQRR